MFHPIFTILVKKPDLVIEHLAGYVALAQEEVSDAGSHMAARAAAWALVGVSGAVFLILAGVAVMMGVMMERFSWVLVLVPGFMLALAIIAVAIARKPLPETAFAEMKKQIDADVKALRIAGSDE